MDEEMTWTNRPAGETEPDTLTLELLLEAVRFLPDSGRVPAALQVGDESTRQWLLGLFPQRVSDAQGPGWPLSGLPITVNGFLGPDCVLTLNARGEAIDLLIRCSDGRLIQMDVRIKSLSEVLKPRF